MPYDIALRVGFEKAADVYAQVRPGYPEPLFDALVSEAGLRRGARLLEIGPGTGLATRPMAERGFNITGVELSPAMAEAGRLALVAYPKVNILTDDFETANLPEEAFDMVFSATALHWIKESVRFSKPHSLLKAGGRLAVIHTNYLTNGSGDKFYKATQPIYRQWAPDTNVNRANLTAEPQESLPNSADIRPFALDPRLFNVTFHGVFPQIQAFSTSEYIDLLKSLSTTVALPEDNRSRFLKAMGNLIDNKFGGMVSIRYGRSLTIGQKIADPDEQAPTA